MYVYFAKTYLITIIKAARIDNMLSLVIIVCMQLLFCYSEEWTPSLSKPFVFFHIEKTGGSELRQQFYNAMYSMGSKDVSIIPGLNSPNTVSSDNLASVTLLNKTACSVAFLGHFRPAATLSVLWAIDQGFFGPVACYRGWPVWKNMRNHTVNKRTSAPYMHIDDFELILKHIYCTMILREPINQRWSHYYHFKYNKVVNLHFADVGLSINRIQAYARELYTNLETGLIYNGMYPFVLQTADAENLTVAKSIFSQCHIGIQEAYQFYYSKLRDFFPRLQILEGHSKISKTSHGQGLPKPETLPYTMRSELAGNSTLDGRLWALAKNWTYSDRHRDPEHKCDLVCWNLDGSWFFPRTPSIRGTCDPC